MGFWSRFYGDVDNAEDRRVMVERSPLTHVDAIRVPLLIIHGANDIRVKRDHSDRIVAALQGRNHNVDYQLFEDEGHGINRTPNRLAFYPGGRALPGPPPRRPRRRRPGRVGWVGPTGRNRDGAGLPGSSLWHVGLRVVSKTSLRADARTQPTLRRSVRLPQAAPFG